MFYVTGECCRFLHRGRAQKVLSSLPAWPASPNFFVCVVSQLGKDVTPKKDPVSTLQSLLGPLELPKLIIAGNLFGVQLMSVNAYLNTSIVYCQWEGWDGIPLDQPPLFYNGLTESAANLLSSVSGEVVKIAKVIELKTGADMSGVRVFNLYENTQLLILSRLL